MPTFTSSIPRPANWQDFERACKVLFECLLDDPHTQIHGRAGQIQYGVDIVGQRNSSGNWVGVQCKRREFEYTTGISEAELRREVGRTKNFRPSLSEYFLLTTAPHDSKIQEVARSITDGERANGRSFKVSVWGWEAIEIEIRQHARAIQAFHPDVTPHTTDILKISRENQATLLAILKRMNSDVRPTQSRRRRKVNREVEDQILNDAAEFIDAGDLSGVLFSITQGIERLPQFVGSVYQGIQVEQPILDFVKKFELGTAASMPRFRHTSRKPELASFGNVLLIIRSITGRMVGPKDNAEVVFLPGTKMIAVGYEVAGDCAIIQLAESASEPDHIEV